MKGCITTTPCSSLCARNSFHQSEETNPVVEKQYYEKVQAG